jgi:hypothetical protein
VEPEEVSISDSARIELAERAARQGLGAAFTDLLAEGAALGDASAIGSARRLTRADRFGGFYGVRADGIRRVLVACGMRPPCRALYGESVRDE